MNPQKYQLGTLMVGVVVVDDADDDTDVVVWV